MTTSFDLVLFLCLYGCMPYTINAMGNTHCPSCPSTKPTTEANTAYTTPQTTAISTKTEAITTTLATSSAYTDPADQKSGLCSDNKGAVIGAAIGGTIFGSILTIFVFVYFRRRSKNSFNSTKDRIPNQTLRTVENAAYEFNNDNDQVNTVTVPVNTAYTEINDGDGESDKEDRSDYYDHAGPAPSLPVMEDGYGVLSMESKENYSTGDRNYSTDSRKSMTAENKQIDNYFILETQNN